jgi:DNA-binding Lrp family transcriptional regulator
MRVLDSVRHNETMAQSDQQKRDSAYQDNYLLQLLQLQDLTLDELTKEVPLRKSAIRDRIARFEREGVILRRAAVLDPQKIGITSQDVLLLELASPKAESEAALDEILTMTAVYRAQAIDHSSFDVMLSLAHGSSDAREATLRQLTAATFVTAHLLLPLTGRYLKEDGLPIYIYR